MKQLKRLTRLEKKTKFRTIASYFEYKRKRNAQILNREFNAMERLVSRDEFGDSWPLTVDQGKVVNRNGAIVFQYESQEYQLNGVAIAQGYQSIDPIWENNPENPSIKMNIGVLIDVGLNLR